MAEPLPDFVRRMLMSGVDPTGTLKTIAVDTLGRLYALLYGSYAGTMHSVALDAQGRMLSVPFVPQGTWAEGELIFSDDFRHGLGPWLTGGYGGGYSVALSTDRSIHSGYSAKLTAGTGVTGWASIAAHLVTGITQRNGLEVMVLLDSNVGAIELWFEYCADATYKCFAVRHTLADGKLYYYDAAGSWTLFDDVHLINIVLNSFVHYKLVIDHTNTKYLRLRLGKSTIDMSSLLACSVASALGESETFHLDIYSKTAVNGIAYISAVNVSQNEPETV